MAQLIKKEILTEKASKRGGLANIFPLSAECVRELSEQGVETHLKRIKKFIIEASKEGLCRLHYSVGECFLTVVEKIISTLEAAHFKVKKIGCEDEENDSVSIELIISW